MPSPHQWKKVLKLAFSFSAQFILGMSANIFLVYKLLPWYNKQDENTKVVVAAFCPLLTAFPKVVSRLAAQKLKDIHPGTAHVFVGVLYGSTAIVFRIMQAELTSFGLFAYAALGVGHAFVDLFERLTITMRDHIWEYFYRFVMRCRRRPSSKYRSPRSRRFMADRCEVPSYNDYQVIGDFFMRAVTGLMIDLVFNIHS
ncbi:hypothetical protein QZH41_018621, partial [Actinostola sp. cb2023]